MVPTQSKKNKNVLKKRFASLFKRRLSQYSHKLSTGESAPEIACPNCNNSTPVAELDKTITTGTKVETTCSVCEKDVSLYVTENTPVVN